ncbi:hypothetical protein ACOSQ2_004363 [Xanthoceras sorbifolium]
MNGYSKIKIIDTTKSRSMDFSSDLLSFPQTQKSTSKTTTQDPKTKFQEPNSQIKNPTKKPATEDEEEEEEEEDHHHQEFNVVGNQFGGVNKLSRTSSVSSASAALKNALSMRRSSSVSERYCRIHDQSVTFASSSSPIDDDEDGVEMERTRSAMMKKKKKNHSKSKILKACKISTARHSGSIIDREPKFTNYKWRLDSLCLSKGGSWSLPLPPITLKIVDLRVNYNRISP